MSRTETVTILFCDVVGSTERVSRLGDDAGDRFLRHLLGVAGDVVRARRGTVIKGLGDGIMAVFEGSTLDALHAAAELHREVGAIDPDDPPRLRVGISAGVATETDGDWYGTPIIEASRLCAVAPTGETYATAVVRSIVGSRGHLAFVDIGPTALKGLPNPVDVVRLETVDLVAAPASGQDATIAPPRRRSRRWLAAAASVVAGAGLIVAVIALIDDSAPAARSGSTVVEMDLDYEPIYKERSCPTETIAGQTCGLLRVPERRDRLDGRWIDVPVDEFAPLDPGDRVAVMIESIEQPKSSVTRDGGRLLRIQPRGTSGADRLNCPEIQQVGLAHITQPLLAPQVVEAHLDAVGRCADRWEASGVDRSAYDLEDVALDVRDLLVARKLEPVDLAVSAMHAASALTIVRDFPQILRTVTFLNPIPPTASTGDYVSAFAEGLDDFNTVCQTDVRCARLTPNLVESWEEFYRQIDAAPELVPAKLSPTSEGVVAVDGDRSATALWLAVGLSPLRPFVPQILANRELLTMSTNAADRSDIHDLAYGQELSDLCHRVAPNDEVVDSDVARRLQPYRTGMLRASVLADSCARWQVPPAPAHFREVVSSHVPAFIVSGDLSTNHLRVWNDEIARNFLATTTLQFPTIGFEPFDEGPQCLADLRRRWLRDPTEPPPGQEISTCEADSPPVNFFG
ncbi:MAG TPA: adenylate/guanylate cyclase domain-containing protein [Microthrixaceae bacterium]|nr:adenylate/guanylate cyclase domain-containing protein [Microthrixaceae bacterium]